VHFAARDAALDRLAAETRALRAARVASPPGTPSPLLARLAVRLGHAWLVTAGAPWGRRHG
jgi:hypothetical protein